MYRSNNTKCRIYIGNLPHDIRSREVEDIFDKYGKIVSVEIKLPKGATHNAPAFAFLEYEDERDAEDAIRARDGYEIDGMKIRCEAPQKEGSRRDDFRGGRGGGGGGGGYGGYSGGGGRGGRGGAGPPERSEYRVMITGLPATGSWQDIKDHMREAGDVVYADVYKDGTGVVEFRDERGMKDAIRNLDDTKFKSHEGESAYVRVKEDRGGRGGRSVSRSRSRSRSRSPRR